MRLLPRSAGRVAEAGALYQRTLVDFARIYGDDHPKTRIVRDNLALTLESENETGGAAD